MEPYFFFPAAAPALFESFSAAICDVMVAFFLFFWRLVLEMS